MLYIQVTYRRMKDALVQLSKGVQKGPAADLIPVLFGETTPAVTKKDVTFSPFNSNLDHSQVNTPNITKIVSVTTKETHSSTKKHYYTTLNY